MRGILSNLIRATGSNLLNALVSILIILILPKKLDIEQYGMYQLYIFYISYASYLCLGWPDGILLRHGGKKYEELNYGMYKMQWYIYLFFIALIGLGIEAIVMVNYTEFGTRKIIYFFVGMDVLIDLPKTYLRYILQMTNKIKEYVQPLLVEKICVIIMFLLCCLMGANNFIIFILIDLVGKIISLICSMYACKNIIFAKATSFDIAFHEGKENIKVGIKLMVANVASMLIIGVVRFSIEKQWNISTFGKISLTLSISNMLMIFIRAVGVVFFPILCRIDKSKISDIYHVLRTVLMIPLLGILVFYYPAKEVLSVWIPQYEDGLKYMAILFPMCIYESKMSMLIETYIKTLRKEKWLLNINIFTVGLSIALSSYTAVYLHNLNYTVAIIVFLLAFRCVCAEIILTRSINLDERKNIFLEIVLTIFFSVSGWFFGSIWTLGIYICVYLIYIYLQREEIKYSIRWIKEKNY